MPDFLVTHGNQRFKVSMPDPAGDPTNIGIEGGDDRRESRLDILKRTGIELGLSLLPGARAALEHKPRASSAQIGPPSPAQMEMAEQLLANTDPRLLQIPHDEVDPAVKLSAMADIASWAVPELKPVGMAAAKVLPGLFFAAPKAAVKEAENMLSRGLSKQQVWDRLGVFQGKDKDWRVESIGPSSVRKGWQPGMTLENVVDQPHVYEAEPAARQVFMDQAVTGQNVAAEYTPYNRYHQLPMDAQIGVAPRFVGSERELEDIQHETQHFLQNFYDWSFMEESDPRKEAWLVRYEREIKRLTGGDLRKYTDATFAKARRLADLATYRESAGEVEANNASLRETKWREIYTREGPEAAERWRKENPPWTTEAVPRELQHVSYGQPGYGTAQQRSTLSPAQIRNRLDDLEDRVRRGELTEFQLGNEREALGLPRLIPEYLRPRSATGGAAPDVTQIAPRNGQTAEAGARQFLMDRLGFVPAGEPEAWARHYGLTSPETYRSGTAQRLTGHFFLPLQPRPTAINPQLFQPVRRGALGGMDDARDFFNQRIAPFQSEREFAEKFFNGAFNDLIEMSMTSSTPFKGGTKGLNFEGTLTDPVYGVPIGHIDRSIFPDEKYASHVVFQLYEQFRGAGFTAGMLVNQFDLYRRLGLVRVKIFANIDVGSYAWLKYGFLPLLISWNKGGIKGDVLRAFNFIEPKIDPATARMIREALNSSDPHALWAISDINDPIYHIVDPRYGRPKKPTTVGKYLLVNQGWQGNFDLANRVQIERFDAYVAKKLKELQQ